MENRVKRGITVLQFIIVFLIDSKLLGIIFTKQKSGPNPFSGTEM